MRLSVSRGCKRGPNSPTLPLVSRNPTRRSHRTKAAVRESRSKSTTPWLPLLPVCWFRLSMAAASACETPGVARRRPQLLDAVPPRWATCPSPGLRLVSCGVVVCRLTSWRQECPRRGSKLHAAGGGDLQETPTVPSDTHCVTSLPSPSCWPAVEYVVPSISPSPLKF
jgi:hypothetical protein